MIDKLQLNACDVTLSSKPTSQLPATREVIRSFELSRLETGYEFVFDGAKSSVTDLKIPLILAQRASHREWRYGFGYDPCICLLYLDYFPHTRSICSTGKVHKWLAK